MGPDSPPSRQKRTWLKSSSLMEFRGIDLVEQDFDTSKQIKLPSLALLAHKLAPYGRAHFGFCPHLVSRCYLNKHKYFAAGLLYQSLKRSLHRFLFYFNQPLDLPNLEVTSRYCLGISFSLSSIQHFGAMKRTMAISVRGGGWGVENLS